MRIGDKTLEGKTAVVTGAGSGIGKASAKLLAHSGARVALLGRAIDPLGDVLKEIGGEEAGHFFVSADVGSEHDMIAAYRDIAARWEHLDILVANAGINGVWAALENLQVEEWDHTLATNLRGTFLTLKFALPLLKAARGASVTVVSSINGTRVFSNTGATAYA
ncbi:MAG: short-chain dehydrogenase/reductase, partial [Akkermansiaceae bacterium]|nr:short-chain dehydrogenase/reductase [Akkermansiaceae bacterium]